MADREKLLMLLGNIEKAVIGKRQAASLLTLALLCRGHVLIEDVPGVGKTTMVRALARSLDLSVRRIQFTPDVMPADLSGYTMYDAGEKKFFYHPGLLMSPVILADEINRASPKTQASLLEAMEERKVTVDGKEYALPFPFVVMATQNPADMTGTYPLPESELDRFLFKIRIGYPEKEDEQKILRLRMKGGNGLEDISPVITAEELKDMQIEVRDVRLPSEMIAYIAELAAATRASRDLSLGVSPRGSIALLAASQAVAYLAGRDYVTPDDVRSMLPFVFSHRLILKKEAVIAGKSAAGILAGIVAAVGVPGLEEKK